MNQLAPKNENNDLTQYDLYAIPPHVAAVLQVWWIKMGFLLIYLVNELIWH